MIGAALMLMLQPVTPVAVAETPAESIISNNASAPSLTRSLPAGAILTPGDVVFAGAISEHDALLKSLIGKQTRRYLPLGAILRASDVREPMLVARNSTVRIAYVKGPLTIAATGRAMSDGAFGETIRVLNLTSKATIAAVVVERGLVRVP